MIPFGKPWVTNWFGKAFCESHRIFPFDVVNSALQVISSRKFTKQEDRLLLGEIQNRWLLMVCADEPQIEVIAWHSHCTEETLQEYLSSFPWQQPPIY